MKTRRIPVASAKKGTNKATLNGIEVHGRGRDCWAEDTDYNTTYTVRIESGAENYTPTKKPVINIKSTRHTHSSQATASKMIGGLGMNNNYCDTLQHFYTK